MIPEAEHVKKYAAGQCSVETAVLEEYSALQHLQNLCPGHCRLVSWVVGMILLMRLQILHDLLYQHPSKYGSIV